MADRRLWRDGCQLLSDPLPGRSPRVQLARAYTGTIPDHDQVTRIWVGSGLLMTVGPEGEVLRASPHETSGPGDGWRQLYGSFEDDELVLDGEGVALRARLAAPERLEGTLAVAGETRGISLRGRDPVR